MKVQYELCEEQGGPITVSTDATTTRCSAAEMPGSSYVRHLARAQVAYENQITMLE